MDRPVEVIGVPMDLGADRRGVDMGPSAIRYGGLADELERIGLTCLDGGDLPVPRPEERDPDGTDHGDRAKYFEETQAVCERLADRVSEAVAADRFPLVLGGDHSIGIGTANGLADERVGILWVDAHADFNTPETTPSGNVHGMPLAAILGEGPFANLPWAHAPSIDAANVSLVGVRSVDPSEREALAASDATAYTMSDIDDTGITEVMEQALETATDGVDRLYVSFDLDVLDPTEAPGVGTPVRGGISYREAHAAMEVLHRKGGDVLSALELVEVNPVLDRENRTAELAGELAASALGDLIL